MSRTASADEIRKAHRALYKRYAQHLNLSVDEVLRELAEEKVKQLNHARDVLLEVHGELPDPPQPEPGTSGTPSPILPRQGRRTQQWMHRALAGAGVLSLGSAIGLLWASRDALEHTTGSNEPQPEPVPALDSTAQRTVPAADPYSSLPWDRYVAYAAGTPAANVILPTDHLWLLSSSTAAPDTLAVRVRGLPPGHVLVDLEFSPAGELWGL